jgi:cobalt-precorrin 5A hydrolase
LVRQALEHAPGAEARGLFSIRDKSGETGLIEAAGRLGLDLVFLTRDALRARASSVQTHSAGSERAFGVPSVAEAAALAGAGADSVLIVPRIAGQGATCAIAVSR